MEHTEKIKVVDGVVIKCLCQPCPECKAKFQAAEEMAKGLRNIKSLSESIGRSTVEEDIHDIIDLSARTLSAWEGLKK